MFVNKQLVIIALVLIFGQAAGMKRKSDEPTGNQNKRAKITMNVDASKLQFIIPSGWVPANELPKSPQYIVSSADVNLSVSPEEQSSLRNKVVLPYQEKTEKIEEEFRSALRKANVGQASEFLKKLFERKTKESVVGPIVLSELPLKEKVALFNQIEKNDQSQGINSFNQPYMGQEPLRTAVKYDNYPAAHALLLRGANASACDEENGRPIMFDVHSSEMLKLLLAHGAPINATDNAGETVLFSNASFLREKIDIATVAITEGVSVNHKNNWGQTAYQAERLGANEYLQDEESANIMARSMLGVTPGFLRNREAGRDKLIRF